MIYYFIRGIAIGIIFGVPIGVIGVLTIQRILIYGLKAGLLSGLGSSVADVLYAAIGCFGLTLFSNLLLKYKLLITCTGCVLIVAIGIKLITSKTKLENTPKGFDHSANFFASSFVIGITNPIAILTFMLAFSAFGISGTLSIINGISVMAGVFSGTCFWWFLLVLFIKIFHEKFIKYGIVKLNRIFGTIVIILAAFILVKMI